MLTQALLVLNILDIAFSQTCYFPDGTIALEDLPCNSSALASTCCGRSYACLSNNICEATSETVKKPGSAIFVRGSCTDSSWTSDSCPTFCVNQTSGDKGGSAGIGKCPDGDGNEYYCVDGAPSNCSAHENVFVFSGAPTLDTILTSPFHSTVSSGTNALTPLSPALAATSSSITTSTTSSVVPTSILASDSSNTKGNVVGAAIGAPLGILALALLVGLWIRSRPRWGRRSAHLASRNDNVSHPPLEDAIPGGAQSKWSKDIEGAPQQHDIGALRNVRSFLRL